MINRQINQINQWGIEDFIIITSPDFDELIREVTSSEFPNLNIKLFYSRNTTRNFSCFFKSRKFCKQKRYFAFSFGDNFFGENPIKDIDFEQI